MKWWEPLEGKCYSEALFPASDASFPPGEITADTLDGLKVYTDGIPVFFGHYWLPETSPIVQRNVIACVDCSVVNKGHLAAYTWQGEESLSEFNAVKVASGGR